MRIVDIEIKRYKSILDQHLSPSEFTVLIGRNNAGKSNVINLLEDFQEYWNKNDPGGEWLESRKYKGAGDSVDIGIQFKLEPEEYSELLVHTSSPKLHRQRGDFREFRVYRNFRDDTQTYSLKVYLDEGWVDPQDLEELDEYPEYFANLFSQAIDKSVSSWRFISPFRKPRFHTNPAHIDAMDSTGEDLIRALDSLRSSPRHAIFEEISEAYIDIMENVTDIRIEYDPDQPQTDQYTLVVVEEGFAEAFKAESISSGSLEILVLLTQIFSAAANSDLLAIEEPELHLHPGAEKKIFDILVDVAETASPQVIITSHSEVFVDHSTVDNIVSVTRDGETRLSQLGEGEQYDLLGYANSDLFQSEVVVFVEGRSDKFILENFSKVLGMPLADNGIEMIVGKGDQLKNDINPISRVLNQLRIPYLLIFDSDGRDSNSKKTELANSLSLSPEKIIVLEKHSIESYLIESPRAISNAANISVREVNGIIDDIEDSEEAYPALNELFKNHVGISYDKERHGAQIVNHFKPGEVHQEIKFILREIHSLRT